MFRHQQMGMHRLGARARLSWSLYVSRPRALAQRVGAGWDVKKLESTDLSNSMKGCGSEKKVKGDSKFFILNEGLRPDAKQRNRWER